MVKLSSFNAAQRKPKSHCCFSMVEKRLVRAKMSYGSLSREERDEFNSLAFRLRSMLVLFESDFARLHGNQCRLHLEHCPWCAWMERFIRLQQGFQTNDDSS